MSIRSMIKFTCAAFLAVGVPRLGAAVTPGAVNTDFAASLAYAEANYIPIVVVWGNTSCPHCQNMAKVVEDSAAFKAYLSEHPIIVVHKHEEYGSKNSDYLAAKDWIKSIKRLTSYPFVGLMWQKQDGTRIEAAFSGVEGAMSATTPKRDLAGQFINSLAMHFGDYNGSTGGLEPPLVDETSVEAAFLVTDKPGDTLQATPQTAFLFAPLKRQSGASAGVNKLVVSNPFSGESEAYRVNWNYGQLQQAVKVSVPGRFVVGRSLKLELQDAAGQRMAQSKIDMIAQGDNSPLNPLWVGERTATTLQYGEWTMDFAVAKEKIARQGGHLFAYFGGPLWCPNCQAIDDDVFDTREFRSWAKRQKVVLVLFEQGQASSPSTPQGTRNGRLLTYDLSRYGTSGAGYLSRKGIDPYGEAPQAVMDQTAELTARWLAPGSTAARLGNPTLLLLDREGENVQARYVRQSEGYTMDLKENLARLEDLIALEDTDERDCYPATTALTLAPGEAASSEFHINRRTLVWRVSGAAENGYLSACAMSDDRNARDVTLSFLDSSGQVLASGRNRVVLEQPTGAIVSPAIYLSASGFGSDANTQFYGKANAFAAEIMLGESDDPAGAAVPFAGLSKSELKAVNPLLYTRQAASVPVYEQDDDGKRTLAGVAAISMSTANRLSVKLTAVGTTVFSGVWQTVNLLRGEVAAVLTTRKGEMMTVEMSPEGKWRVAMDKGATGSAWALSNGKSFAGKYTLALAPEGNGGAYGYLTLNVSGNGRFTAAGYVADGERVSGSGNLAGAEDGAAVAAIVRKSGKGLFSAALRILPNASATWGSTEAIGTVELADEQASAAWQPTAGEMVRYGVWGGYWKSGATPASIAADFETPSRFLFTAGDLVALKIVANGSGFAFERGAIKSLAVSRTTGELTGRMEIAIDGRKVSANIRGVATPGWHDCGCTAEPVVEHPFAVGMVYWTDKRVRNAVAIEIDYED